MSFPIMAAALGLSEFAPLIARWLGGHKAHDIAVEVVDIAKRITGTTDPVDAIRQLQEQAPLMIEFQRAILEMEASIELTYMKDRQDARWRDVAMAQAGRKNLRADIMVLSAAGGLVLCLIALGYFAADLPGEAVGIISTIAGIFGACLKDAYAFEFGSSRESKEKDSTLAALMERNLG